MSVFLNTLFGDALETSQANVFGGENFYGAENESIGYSQDNVFGGQTYFGPENEVIGYTQENVFGGETFFDDNNQNLGAFHENQFGGMDYFETYDFGSVTAQVEEWKQNLFYKMDSANGIQSFDFPNLL